MKKLFLIPIFLISFFTHTAFSADQWDKAKPAGSDNRSDIDTIIQTNNSALDRLLSNYRRGLGVNFTNANTLSVLPGELTISNASGSLRKLRYITSATPVTWSDIDTGSEATSTTYYLYATADTDITGMIFKISANSSAPQNGSTYYRVIAQFYNDSTGSITNLVSYRADHGTDYPDTIKARINFNGTGTISINEQYNVSSITDNGTGDYTINFATPFGSSNYSIVGSNSQSAAGTLIVTFYDQTSSSVKLHLGDVNGTASDSLIVSVIATGDR